MKFCEFKVPNAIRKPLKWNLVHRSRPRFVRSCVRISYLPRNWLQRRILQSFEIRRRLQPILRLHDWRTSQLLLRRGIHLWRKCNPVPRRIPRDMRICRRNWTILPLSCYLDVKMYPGNPVQNTGWERISTLKLNKPSFVQKNSLYFVKVRWMKCYLLILSLINKYYCSFSLTHSISFLWKR